MNEQAKERNEEVLAVLKWATEPLGPTEIGRRIGKPWCSWGGNAGLSAPITPVLRRIGAVRVQGGKYLAPALPQGAPHD
jgi:hypothetical protein